MTFNFIKSRFFNEYSKNLDSFKIDIPVSFEIPNIYSTRGLRFTTQFNRSHQSYFGPSQEVSDILDALGITNDTRHSFKISKGEVIVRLKHLNFDIIKTTLLRDQKLRELLN